MGNHYYDQVQSSPHNRKVLSFRFLSVYYQFESDSGVFSKDGLDTGTRILLETLVKQGLSGKVLDYGCGIGPIGIILKKEFEDLEVEGFDINQRAVDLAIANAKLNAVDVNFYQSNQIQQDHYYDHIILNPPIRSGKQNIYAMFKDSFEHLNEGGRFWIVIRKSHGALSAIKELESYFTNVRIIHKDKGFFVIESSKTIDN